jgi:hypothetical protein
MASLLNVLFGCTHRNMSFPLTVKPGQRRSEAASVTGTYVVCLKCGKEFPYDWATMKVVSARQPSARGHLAEVESFAGNTR